MNENTQKNELPQQEGTLEVPSAQEERREGPVLPQQEPPQETAPEELQADLQMQETLELQESLQRIRQMDPAIRSAADLMQMEQAEAFRAYLQRGNSMEDAFFLANRSRLLQQVRDAAGQEMRNRITAKEHLTATASRGSGAVRIPREELALYRELNPGASEAEIQRHYNHYRRAGRTG